MRGRTFVVTPDSYFFTVLTIITFIIQCMSFILYRLYQHHFNNIFLMQKEVINPKMSLKTHSRQNTQILFNLYNMIHGHNNLQTGQWRSRSRLLRENRVVEQYLQSQENKLQPRQRKFLNRKVLLEEPEAMSMRATSVISDARLKQLTKYLESEVTNNKA